MENLKEKSGKKIISRDSFIELLKSKNMPEEDAIELVDGIYNEIHERYKIKTESGNTPGLDEAANNKRNSVFTQFYYLVKNIYNIEQIKNLTQEVRNNIVKKIMESCKSAITDDFNSWDYTKSNDFIKLLFDKYNDTNSDKIIECIDHYIKCEKKDLIDRIINKTIKETYRPCDIDQVTKILKTYNLMINRFNKYEINDKGNNKKVKIEKIIELAELCIENKLPNEEIVELFINATRIINSNPESYYDVIENNYELAKKGKIETKKVVDTIKDIADNAVSQKKNEPNQNSKKKNIKKPVLNMFKGSINKNSKNNDSTNNRPKRRLKRQVWFFIGLLAGAAGVAGVSSILNNNKSKNEEKQQYEELSDTIYDDFESTDFRESLPISIQCIVTEKLGPYGPEEGSLVTARVSTNGEMKSIVWQNSDGNIKTITNNLENYMNYLIVADGTRETTILSDYTGEDEEYKKGDIVEIVDGPFISSEGTKMVTVKKDGGYNSNVPYEIIEESKYNLNSVQAYARGLKGKEIDDATKIMPQQFTFTMDYTDPNSGIEYKAGESILGYVTVEEGQTVVKKTKTVNGENEDVTVPFYGYFDISDREVESQQGIIDRIVAENGKITTDQPIFTWGNDYDELVSIVPENEEIGIMVYEKEDGLHLVGTSNNIELGELEGYDIYEGLEKYLQSIQPESINSYIEELYPDKEKDTYYNGIFVPKEIPTNNLKEYLNKQITNIIEGPKMPNTENSNNDITYVEISNDTDLIERLKAITERTGTPYGLYIEYDSSKMTTDDVKRIINQIQDSECGKYFQGGIIIDPSGLPENKYNYMSNEFGMMLDFEGNPVTEIKQEYTDEIDKINSLLENLKKSGIKTIILDSNDSSLDTGDIDSETIYALEVKRSKKNKWKNADREYYNDEYKKSKKVSVWFDEEKGQLAVDDDMLREALLTIAGTNEVTITEEDINMEPRY